MASHITQTVIPAPIGRLAISSCSQYVHQITLDTHNIQTTTVRTRLLIDTITQMEAFFQDAHHEWSIPLALKGTAFQRKVWQFLQSIPVGETLSYGEIAKRLNTSAQAVGNACRANPFIIVVPCHRVVSSNGIGGYSGKTEGQEIVVKQWLLDHERS